MNLGNDGAMSRAIFDWNYVLWEVRLTLLAAGFFIYLGVFLLAHWLSSWISASYRTLSAKQKVFWNMDITRGLFAVQSCGAGLWALLIDPDFQADQVYSQQKWSWFHCLIAAGFFLLENIVVHVSIIVFRIFDVFSAVHHLFAFGGLLGLIINIKSGHYLPLMGLLLEMCTPPLCISFMLLKTGYAHTLLWKANQWVLIHMQHCRMVLTYHMWWVCISNWNDVVENLGLPYFIVFFMGLSILTLILNPYWTYKSTQIFFSPVDRTFRNIAEKNGSSEKLNSEAFQKKRI
ncbi:protein CLN8-like [Gopherus flavomarginatus]|uniref:protein CLN8-like n=1 Tax=Gopherus flavomarginatus TaxID=286002 RepID=UPI0021CC3134|nr:protein CLN8-like [Gopherus flavomarginatus]